MPAAPIRLHRSVPLTYWHLFSLDAPTVAMLWTWFIARSNNVRLGLLPILSMGIAVWMLYATDRLFDSRTSGTQYQQLEPRHFFHQQFRRQFGLCILASVLALALFVPRLPSESLRLYAILGTLLAAYFLLIHGQRIAPTRLPKEIAVGIFFSAATFIPTIARHSFLRSSLLPVAVLFGLLCALNCLFIYAWEHPAPYRCAHPATRVALRFIGPLVCVTILLSLALVLRSTSPRQLPAAIAAAATLLSLLHSNRVHFDPSTRRAAADLCLLTPILFALALPA